MNEKERHEAPTSRGEAAFGQCPWRHYAEGDPHTNCVGVTDHSGDCEDTEGYRF